MSYKISINYNFKERQYQYYKFSQKMKLKTLNQLQNLICLQKITFLK